ncbi:MAG: hypothetical protein QOF02_3667 [Blastocatellia bacterium]|jgi:hypothetical protein|nr:hypothetical protein [Blastocatellia bacterium]
MVNRRDRRAIEKKLKKKASASNASYPRPSAAAPTVSRLIADESKTIWRSIIRAVGAEPKEAEFIRGASGIHHNTIAIGIDDEKNRVIVISGEHDARAAAMAQADIQSALKSAQVIVARPIAINLARASQAITTVLGKPVLGNKEFAMLNEGGIHSDSIKLIIEKAGIAFATAFPNILPNIMQAIQQLSKLKLDNLQAMMRDDGDSNDSGREDSGDFALHLDELNKYDPAAQDVKFGICPFPLYDFSTNEIDVLLSGRDLDAARELLRHHDLLQYFYPAADQIALGLVDRGIGKPSDLLEQLEQAPALGHPYGSSEITTTAKNFGEVIDELVARKLIIEGEVSLETTPEGETVRQTVKFKPREGLLSKLLNRIEVKIDLKSLFSVGQDGK